MKKIILDTDFIGSVGFSKLLIRKVSGNCFRKIFFYLVERLELIDNYDKSIDAILIIKNGKDN